MELTDMSVVARNLSGGSTGFDATAGQSLKIETSPIGLDVLNVQVPEDERWHIQINIQIEKFTV